MHQSHKTSGKNLGRTSATPDVARHFPHQSQAYFSAFNLSLSLSLSLSLFKSNLHGQALTWTNQFGVEDTITSGWVVMIYDNFVQTTPFSDPSQVDELCLIWVYVALCFDMVYKFDQY